MYYPLPIQYNKISSPLLLSFSLSLYTQGVYNIQNPEILPRPTSTQHHRHTHPHWLSLLLTLLLPHLRLQLSLSLQLMSSGMLFFHFSLLLLCLSQLRNCYPLFSLLVAFWTIRVVFILFILLSFSCICTLSLNCIVCTYIHSYRYRCLYTIFIVFLSLALIVMLPHCWKLGCMHLNEENCIIFSKNRLNVYSII